jgi:SAM-dependent methyltransferase
VLYETKDRLCHIAGHFALVRCNDCGVYYLNPRPTQDSIEAYYPTNYDPFARQTVQQLPLLRRLSVQYGLRKRCHFIRTYKAQGRLLDIGCATGQFLAEMRRYPGWQVYGVEPGREAAQFAQHTLGLDVHEGELASAAYPDAYFDAVTMWDVLEHLHEPRDVLSEIARILKPDGVLALRTPSLGSWDARVFGPYWAGLDSPRHLAIFSRDTSVALLGYTGFTLRKMSTGGGSYFINLISLRFWLDETLSDGLIRRTILGLAGSSLTRLALALPLTILDRCGLGSEMMIIAQPQGR